MLSQRKSAGRAATSASFTSSVMAWTNACSSGWEVGEFRYQPHRWKGPHRFVVVRRPIPEDPIEAKQRTLFKDRKYAYHVLVTNLKVHPFRVWQFYAKRAAIEKNIRR